MADSLTRAFEGMDSSYFQLKKKFHAKKLAEEEFSLEIERLGLKVEKVKNESIYKVTKLEDKVSKLEDELAKLKERNSRRSFSLSGDINIDEDDVEEKEWCLRIASTVSIFETILNTISSISDGFKYMGYSVVYPAVYSKLLQDGGEDFTLTCIPDKMDEVIMEGVTKAKEIYDRAYSHLSSEKEWNNYSEEVQLWWKLIIIPKIYEGREGVISSIEDFPVWSRETTLSWVNNFESRPFNHPEVSDALNMYIYNIREIGAVNGVDGFNSRKRELLASIEG